MVFRDSTEFAARSLVESNVTRTIQRQIKETRVAAEPAVVTQRVEDGVRLARKSAPSSSVQQKFSKESLIRSRLRRKSVAVNMSSKQIDIMTAQRDVIIASLGADYYNNSMRKLYMQLMGDSKIVDSDNSDAEDEGGVGLETDHPSYNNDGSRRNNDDDTTGGGASFSGGSSLINV